MSKLMLVALLISCSASLTLAQGDYHKFEVSEGYSIARADGSSGDRFNLNGDKKGKNGATARGNLIAPYPRPGVDASPASAQSKVVWSGFYIGADIGFASTRLRAGPGDATGPMFSPFENVIYQLTNIRQPGLGIVIVPSTTRGIDDSNRQMSLLYGGLAGRQWQAGSLVFGVEGDLHGSGGSTGVEITHSIPPTLNSPTSTVTLRREARTSYDWSARGRFGYAFGRNLLYATGGVAGAQVRLKSENSYFIPSGPAGVTGFVTPALGPIVITATERRMMMGWTAGLGGERQISRRLSLGLEVRYTDSGSKIFDGVTRCGSTTSASFFGGVRLPTIPEIIRGECPGVTRSAPTLIVNDTSFPGGVLNPLVDPTPAALPGPTRIDLTNLRLNLRLIFRF